MVILGILLVFFSGVVFGWNLNDEVRERRSKRATHNTQNVVNTYSTSGTYTTANSTGFTINED